MVRYFLLILLLAACSDTSDSHRTAAVFEPPADPPPVALGVEVELQSGVARGQEHTESSVWEWLAIPFAAPPIEDLRWKAPRPVAAWDGVRDTVSLGPKCPQIDPVENTVVGDEDCLHLNVWRPRTEERGLPVYVWIHGGGNTGGANSLSSYQGDRVAQNSNMVVVSIQYRLGPLGWFYFDPLHTGDALDDSGSYGLLDIIESLNWIQNNIEVFGGDPGNVIVTGESAGAINTMSLLVSPQASGLFHKAIIQSGLPRDGTPESGNVGARKMVDNLLAPAGEDAGGLFLADELAQALREMPVADLINNYEGPYHSFRDGTVLPLAGVAVLETANHINKVPIIVGTNKDEFKLYTNPLLLNALPGVSAEVRAGVGRYASDMWRVLGADKFAGDITSADDQPEVYVYRFNWGSPNEDGLSPLPGSFGATLGAHHGLEIPFVLGNWEKWVDPRGEGIFFVPENALGRENLSGVIMTYFAAFARSGNPNGDNLPAWEPFSTQPGFKAIQFDVDLADSSAKITADTESWTIELVLAELEANLVEPTKTIVLAILNGIGVLDI